ncbi:hypothetical protein [Nonomuraea sp. NPDC049758]|uniref:hypothetical protein n=1 Tax=Nonomuraea sp. NPDC049758 TaxID=3154360 RepID=UPI003416C5DC
MLVAQVAQQHLPLRHVMAQLPVRAAVGVPRQVQQMPRVDEATRACVQIMAELGNRAAVADSDLPGKVRNSRVTA